MKKFASIFYYYTIVIKLSTEQQRALDDKLNFSILEFIWQQLYCILSTALYSYMYPPLHSSIHPPNYLHKNLPCIFVTLITESWDHMKENKDWQASWEIKNPHKEKNLHEKQAINDLALSPTYQYFHNSQENCPPPKEYQVIISQRQLLLNTTTETYNLWEGERTVEGFVELKGLHP